MTKTSFSFDLEPLPANEGEALEWLLLLVRAGENKKIGGVSRDLFKRGWYSIGFLYPGLHPDSALDHGTGITSEIVELPEFLREYFSNCYVQSGWPVVLAPVAEEAWRRYDAGELKDEEFYCSEAVISGMCNRNPRFARSVGEERMGWSR